MMQVEQAKRWFRTKGTCFQSHTLQRFQIADVAAADSEAPASDDSEELFYPLTHLSAGSQFWVGKESLCWKFIVLQAESFRWEMNVDNTALVLCV